MKTSLTKAVLLAAAGALAACSTVTVTTDYDHAANFGKYKTYTLAPPPHGPRLTPTSDAALREALRTELAARGITEATSGRGDLAIVPQVFTQDKISVQQYEDWGYRAGTGYGGAWAYRYGTYGTWSGA